jgi:hypothetical protein
LLCDYGEGITNILQHDENLSIDDDGIYWFKYNMGEADE